MLCYSVLRIPVLKLHYIDSPLNDDSYADLGEEDVEAEFVRRQRRTWRPGFRDDVDTRPGKGGDVEFCPSHLGEAVENVDEPGHLGEAVENADEPAETLEDVVTRPTAVEEPNAGRDLPRDVTAALVTAIKPRQKVPKTRDNLTAIK